MARLLKHLPQKHGFHCSYYMWCQPPIVIITWGEPEDLLSSETTKAYSPVLRHHMWVYQIAWHWKFMLLVSGVFSRWRVSARSLTKKKEAWRRYSLHSWFLLCKCRAQDSAESMWPEVFLALLCSVDSVAMKASHHVCIPSQKVFPLLSWYPISMQDLPVRLDHDTVRPFWFRTQSQSMEGL